MSGTVNVVREVLMWGNYLIPGKNKKPISQPPHMRWLLTLVSLPSPEIVLDAHSIRSRSLQGIEATKQRKREDQMQTSAPSLISGTTEDQSMSNVCMIEPEERKHELSLLAHSVGDYQLPVFAELPRLSTDSNTRSRKKNKNAWSWKRKTSSRFQASIISHY